ncbi:MAG: glycoside hydrolase family 3 C-terminal domain-containing protein, partial [Actinomycetota bacterium]
MGEEAGGSDRHPGAFAESASRVRDGADPTDEAAALVDRMTRAEKLDCLDGDTDFWPGIADLSTGGYHVHPWPAAAVPALGVPGLQFADGPRGCVIDPATCFPVSMARGAAFDPDLEHRIGEAIGAELRVAGATFTGAVCINLLRHPAWGRAQETYGEDPHHVGELAVAFVEGLQRHVMACAKHFALNSMENARFTVDVTVDERALHEVYLPHFRRVAEAGVASVMSAYNSVNGSWCGESEELLTDILRHEWGWEGAVISDFVFGLRDPIKSVTAGLDIEMPLRQQRREVLADAVEQGVLDEAVVDACVTRTVAMLLRFADRIERTPPASRLLSVEHRALAREAATAGTVLVRNAGALLPVDPDEVRSVAVVGRLAREANLGDGGSSAVTPPETVTVLDGLRARFGSAAVRHADSDPSIVDGADLAVVVVGYTAADEGEYLDDESTAALAHLFPPPPEDPPARDEGDPAERSGEPPREAARDRAGFLPGGDRRSLRLHPGDEELIAHVAERSERVVVAVMSGSAVVMPWLEDVAATLMIWYPGMEGGHAVADILTGRAEPGGRLPFAVPRDEPDLVEFDPDASEATYGLFHGQWHLDREGVAAHLPFGWGLGYTTWSVDGAVVAGAERTGSVVTATVTNTRTTTSPRRSPVL